MTSSSEVAAGCLGMRIRWQARQKSGRRAETSRRSERDSQNRYSWRAFAVTVPCINSNAGVSAYTYKKHLRRRSMCQSGFATVTGFTLRVPPYDNYFHN